MFTNLRNFSDIISIIIKDDQNNILCIVENNFITLPYSKNLNNASWKNQVLQDIKDAVGLELAATSIYKIIKVWLQDLPGGYVTSCFLLLQLSAENRKKCKPSTGKFVGKTKWLSENDIQKFYQQDAVCSHILLEFYPKLLEKGNDPLLELQCAGILYEITEENITGVSYKNAYEATVENSGLKAVQLLIYREFINNCYPNVLMSPIGFCRLLSDWGMPKEDTIFLFRAADLLNRKFLTFKEFMYVLSVLEPATSHGGISGEIRCRYIFRFFDRDQDGYINLTELKNMIIYMRKSKNLPVDQTNIDKEQKAYCTSLNITPVKSMNLGDFLKCAGDLRIRGLSQVMRLPRSVKNYLQLVKGGTNKQANEGLKLGRGEGGKGNDFDIAVHSIKIQKSGTMINLEKIWNLNSVASATTLQQASITKETRRLSFDIHSEESDCNELIKNLRYLAKLNNIKSGNRGNKKEQYKWGNVNASLYAIKLNQVCTSLQNILKNEPRLLDIRSPAYILGDFHGNFGDLQYFEKIFWPLCPGFCPGNLLFLGDYIDRGFFGIEVVTYLFCYKLLYPHKINLVRGNHEIREVQKNFTFWAECLAKFGDKIGAELWNNINIVFDFMPLAAVIDGKIFCCHGGIPPPWLCPVASAINSIPVPLSEPDKQSSLAWEILWNDPIRDKQITAEVDVELKLNEGFAMNAKRGTGHVFNSDGLERFLNVNGFSHVIRAHEMVATGYNVLLKGKLLTVFSTSNYNNGNNEAACVLVDHGRLRMMRLDSSGIIAPL